MSWSNGYNLQLSTSTMNTKVVFNGVSDINSLGNVINSISLPSLLYGKWTEFTSSCMFYPMNLARGKSTKHLIASGITFNNIKCYGGLNPFDESGYTLGEYYYPEPASFLDYEPYTKCELYLPYYGFTRIKIADVAGKYIQFRLYVDYSSGQACYVISVNDNAINDTTNLPFISSNAYTTCRVISSLVFQLGYNIPITTANFNDTIRNIASMAVKGTAMTAVGLVGKTINSGSETVKEITTARNPDTGRQLTTSTKTRETQYDRRTYRKGSAINTAVETATSILSNIDAHGSRDKPNNVCLNGAISRDIVIIKTKAKTTIDVLNDASYKHLVGLPNGTCALLSTLSGYTKISDIHIEGDGLGQATSKEISELESLCYQGIML